MIDKAPGDYLSKRVLGVGAYSRGRLIREWGLIYSSQFKSGGLSEQIKNIYLYYIFDELYFMSLSSLLQIMYSVVLQNMK